MTRNHHWTDQDYLTVLHMADAQGLTAAKIAARTGFSRNAVIGAIHRVRADDAATPDHCVINVDGSMPEAWWRR